MKRWRALCAAGVGLLALSTARAQDISTPSLLPVETGPTVTINPANAHEAASTTAESQDIIIAPELVDTLPRYLPDLRGWYFRGDLIWLQRNRWEGSTLATSGSGGVIDADDLDSQMEIGAKFTIGQHLGPEQQWEVSGWWVSDMGRSRELAGPFNVSMPVYNHPFSFDDFATNVSYLDIDYLTDVAGVEGIKRTWLSSPCTSLPCTQPLRIGTEIGLRYLNVDEEFSIYSQYGPAPAAGGFQDFDYMTDTDNHIIAGMFGLVTAWDVCPGVRIEGLIRYSSGLNIIETHARLKERTGNVAFSKERDDVEWSHIIETGITGTWRFHEHMAVRAGYQMLYLVGYAGAVDQFAFNLAKPGQYDDDNSIILHGPMLGFELTW